MLKLMKIEFKIFTKNLDMNASNLVQWKFIMILALSSSDLHQPFKRQVKSHLLALLGAHHILNVSRVRVKLNSINCL